VTYGLSAGSICALSWWILVAWRSLVRTLPTSPEVIGAHTLNSKPNFKFSRLTFLGTPSPLRCALARLAWWISSAYKNLRAKHSLRAKILCPEKCPLGWVNMHLYVFFVCGSKFTKFLLSNVGWVVVDQTLFRFSICRPVPEMFAIKVESFQKSRRNLAVLAVFGPPKF